MSSQKRVKMKKSSPSKELLINWLRTALDYEMYPGLGWSDREKEIFYVKWVHKSSEQWSGDDLAPFKAWAAHKGKLDGKNAKQLKATFRCALNSKKELEEHHRDRERRYWQFVDPNLTEKDKAPKRKRRNNKATKPRMESTVTDACKKEITTDDELLFPRISTRNEDERVRPTKLPAFDLFSNFEPLTPPDHANEITYNCPDLKFPKENIDKLRNCAENSRDMTYSPTNVSSTNVNNSFIENTNEACTLLPPFEIFGSFHTLTPPPQKNEVYFISTEYRPNYTPPPDQSRLTPPQKSYHTSQDSYYHTNTDAWQPNYWPNHTEDKKPKGLSDFFSSDFIGLYKSSTQEPESNNTMDFLDMDQHVPVTNACINAQIYNKNSQSIQINRMTSNNDMETDHLLEKLDDLFLGDNVDPEMCRQLMQEIETSSSPQYRFQN